MPLVWAEVEEEVAVAGEGRSESWRRCGYGVMCEPKVPGTCSQQEKTEPMFVSGRHYLGTPGELAAREEVEPFMPRPVRGWHLFAQMPVVDVGWPSDQ